jgi:hypothetical protein
MGIISQGVFRIHDGIVDHFGSFDGLSSDFVQRRLRHFICCSTCSEGKHDLSFWPRTYAFQHEMSLAGIRERQDCTHARFQFSTIDEAGDLFQMFACYVDQKECGFDALGFRKILIGTGYRRNQLAASMEYLE